MVIAVDFGIALEQIEIVELAGQAVENTVLTTCCGAFLVIAGRPRCECTAMLASFVAFASIVVPLPRDDGRLLL